MVRSTFEGIESTGERDTYSDWSDMIQSGGIPDDITFAYGKALGKQIGSNHLFTNVFLI